jgi:putative acetyltransferase
LNRELSIRPETLHDHGDISRVITRAFAGAAHADGNEAEIVQKLRHARALSVSLVAETQGTIVGHIAFSPAYASDGTSGWYTLGPLAVLPAHQRAGIGAKLVDAGLKAITELGASGCIVVGDPAYYSRFGFRLSPSNSPDEELTAVFMLKPIKGPEPDGPIGFHEAFQTH